MINKIKYGILGAGHLGNYHADQLKKIAAVDLVGVFDIKIQNSQKLSTKYKIKMFDSPLDLLKECSAVSITTPASNHFFSASLALKNNCHVFIEKPIVQNLQEAKKIIQLKQSQKKKVQVGHIERFNSAFSAFLATSPSPRFVEAHRLCAFNKRGLDVDVVLDLMIHDIDLVLCLINSQIKNIYASGTAVLTDSIDMANARLEFYNGAVANLTASRISLKQMRQMRVFQKNSYSVLDFQSQQLNSWFVENTCALKEKSFIIPPKNALFEELNSFINSILNNLSEEVGAEEAIRALKIASKIQRKIEQNKK